MSLNPVAVRTITPDLAVGVDQSGCIVLVCSDIDGGHTFKTITNVDHFIDALRWARAHRDRREEDE